MKIIPIVILAAFVASPAFAGNGKWRNSNARMDCRNLSVGDQDCRRSVQRNGIDVRSYDGRLIGRDPDPNVRMRLRDEDARYHLR